MSNITSTQFGTKYRTKKELERFVRTDMDCYMCDSEYLDCFYYRDIISGKKRVSAF